MSSDPWTSRRFDYPYLRVAPHTQPDDEAYCVPYALWMVNNYVGNEYTDQRVKERTNVRKAWEIVDQLDPDLLTGWKPNQKDLTEVSAMTSTLSFSLDEWPGQPPKSLFELVEENLKDDLPLIVFVDSQLLRHGIRTGRGADHAVVICGFGINNDGEEMAVIADPWYAALHEWRQDKLENAWDPSRHQIINVAIDQTPTSES